MTKQLKLKDLMKPYPFILGAGENENIVACGKSIDTISRVISLGRRYTRTCYYDIKFKDGSRKNLNGEVIVEFKEEPWTT